MTARQTLRLGLFAIVAFVLGLVAARMLLHLRQAPPPQTENATILPAPRALPALDLVDQDGRTLPSHYLEGHWSFVFFGFTHCPDICPTTLAVLSQVHKLLAAMPTNEQPRVLFISVDPERDTPARLKEYVHFFDPTFIGATGTPAAVQQVATAFSVPFIKVPLPGGGYTMDHGAGIFFIAPSGRIVAYASPPLRADVLERDYRKTVQYVGDSG